MKTIKLFTILLFTFILACSKSDDSSNNKGINAQNLVTTIDENPVNGDIIGTLQAVGDGTLSFAIASQTVAGALNINPSTGVISVADASLFDFETNPIISANISIIDASNSATATATFNLNDIDDIESFLSTSKSAYSSANDGDWVIITEVEYNALANSLNEVSRVGSTESEYTDSAPTTQSTTGEWVASNITTATVPSGSYVFAFKYSAFDVTNITTSKVKLSTTSISDGYSDLGSALPSHSGTMEDVYFVLKGNMALTSTLGYLSFFKADSTSMGIKSISGQNYYWVIGDTNSGLTLFDNYRILYQGLSTTQKQW